MNLNHFQVVAKFEAYIPKANNWYACSLLQSRSSPIRKTLRKATEKAEESKSASNFEEQIPICDYQ